MARHRVRPAHAGSVETIDTPPGGGYGSSTIHAEYTHSLVGALVLSAVLAGAALPRWGRRIAALVGAVVFSHWLLDLVVHRPDMPILPGNAGDLPLLGFGLWRLPAVSLAVEALLVVAGTYLYWRTAARDAGGPHPGRVTPNVVAAVLLVSGALVLTLDGAGV